MEVLSYKRGMLLMLGLMLMLIFQSIYALPGFDGAIGSSDATYIGTLQCPYCARINHKGFKLTGFVPFFKIKLTI
jgi:hypothetical protein